MEKHHIEGDCMRAETVGNCNCPIGKHLDVNGNAVQHTSHWNDSNRLPGHRLNGIGSLRQARVEQAR